MPKSQRPFQEIIAKLKKYYGSPRPPKTTDPFEMVLLENVAYLVGDEQREEAFDGLRDRVGLSPVDIVTAHDEKLLEVARLGGMLPAARVEKLRRIANIALQESMASEIGAERTAPQSQASAQEVPRYWRPECREDSALYANSSGAAARIERLARAVAAGVRRGAEELLGDLPRSAGCG